MCYATPAQSKIFTEKLFNDTLIKSDFSQLNDFQGLHFQIFAKISLYTTLAQPDFYYISTIWFQDSTPAQHGIFVGNMIVHFIQTIWLSLNSYNLISGFYTCTIWNLYLCAKMAYFTLHLHSLIFGTFAKHGFRGFFILLCVYVFLHIHISYLYLCIN